jgi:hypothetical protein
MEVSIKGSVVYLAIKGSLPKITGWERELHFPSIKRSCKVPGTRFEARNCINEPGLQKPYWDIFIEKPCRS